MKTTTPAAPICSRTQNLVCKSHDVVVRTNGGMRVHLRKVENSAVIIRSSLRRGYFTTRESDMIESLLLALACENVKIDSRRFAAAIDVVAETFAR